MKALALHARDPIYEGLEILIKSAPAFRHKPQSGRKGFSQTTP
jgi:hypothetical protein